MNLDVLLALQDLSLKPEVVDFLARQVRDNSDKNTKLYFGILEHPNATYQTKIFIFEDFMRWKKDAVRGLNLYLENLKWNQEKLINEGVWSASETLGIEGSLKKCHEDLEEMERLQERALQLLPPDCRTLAVLLN